MRKRFTRLPRTFVLTAIGISYPGLVYSMDLSFRPRIETGMEYYKIEQDNLFQLEGNTSESASSLEASDWMPILSGGITVIANRFYVDVSGLKAFNGEDDVNRKFSTLDLGNPIGNSTGSVRGDSDFDRWEYSVSLGYLLTDNLSLFAGYRKSEVDLKFKTDLIVTGGPTAGTADTVRVDGTFEQDGPFVGASYGWRIENGAFKGTLSGSLAFAALDGKLNIDDVDTNVVPEDNVPDDSSDGDTIGMKVGFTWIGSLPLDNLSYSLGVDGYKYDFDANDDDPDVTETVINLKAGLAYRF